MDSLKEITNFDGLYGDENGKYSSEYLFLEPISTRSKEFDWQIKPHIHLKLFQVFVVKKGSLRFTDAISEYELNAPCLMVIPAMALHGLVYHPDIEGSILTLSEKIIEDIFETSHRIWQTFEKVRIIQSFDENGTFEKMLYQLALAEYELFSENPERMMMIKACLTQFFLHIHRLATQDADLSGDSLQMAYFRKFLQNIKKSSHQKSIPDFAEELNISAVHLNRICKAIAGKSAIELVHQHLIQEAQKYLLHTSYSISEIAYLLEFEYPNYFAKLFKKHIGLSPAEYRQVDRR
ncbi:helix-turn-helix domain-containing protein [Flectobacillus sp. DC10W]|uniref:Helix-turn-helix domain-containing protein n=1 Tax=Flectobacillus longus TaxID=2984207 RepID=A0ABT6YTT2_9BACT|nr:helix-turn-helix domain-containing protein [Flectobacillus longus]MDI9866999.1 helix-turn-helix domain-containing protein [Flectobacillus longus]